jgi:succinoglycan biosynthesis transport protein ExoP
MYNRMPPRGSGSYPVGSPVPSVEDTDRVDLRDLFRKIWLRRKMVVGCILVCSFLAGAMVSQVTPLYTALSKIMLDPRKGRIVTTEAVVSDLDVSEQVVNSEAAVLRSNVLIEAVIDELGFEKLRLLDGASARPSLTSSIKSLIGLGPATNTPASDAILKAQKTERLIFAIRRALSVRREGESYVISISVETPDAQLSALLAATIADQYIIGQLTGRQTAATRASGWIEDRLNVLRSEVEAAETAVEDYRAKSLVLDGASLETASSQLFEMSNRLALARSDRATTEALYQQITSVIEAKGVHAAESLVKSPILDALAEQRVALMQKDAIWAERYDATHPTRKNLANEITQANAEIAREITRQVDVKRNEVDTARILEASMAQSLNEMEQRIVQISANAVGLRELERKLAATRQTYEELLSRLSETQSQEVLQRADAKLVERATIPGAPSSPRPKLVIALGGMAGAAIGLTLAFFLELSGSTFRSEAEIERETGLPVLAAIPLGDWKSPRAAYRELERAPHGVYAERIRHLRTALLTPSKKDAGKSILVTSSVPMEGKTTTTLAFAKMASLAGKSVIVVDCDLRRSSLQRTFGWDMDYDLADFIHDECSLGDAVYSDARLGFDVLASTDPLPSAADQLSENWLKPMLNMLTRFYDVVLLDAPPALAVSDALILSQVVDSTIYLVRWDETPRAAVAKGLTSFAEMGKGPDGIVMTMVDPKFSAMSYTDEYAYSA